MRAFVIVAYHREVEQVGGFQKYRQAATERFLGRKFHAEVIVLPDIVVVPVADVGEPGTDVAACKLRVPAVTAVLEQKREIGYVGGLSEQRSGLSHGYYVVALHGAFVGGDAGVSEGVVGLDAELAEILQNVDFRTHIVRVAHIHRHVICVLSFVYESIFNGVLQVLVEKTGHELFGRFRKELPPQVYVVGYGVFQRGIALLLVFLVDDAVRNNFEEARPVYGAGVTETEVHTVGQNPLDVQARQEVGVLLSSDRVNVAREFQGIALTGVFHTQTCYKFPIGYGKPCHRVAGGYPFVRVIVQRVAHIAELARSDQNPVKIIPILSENLDVSGAGGGIESVFVEKAVAVLCAEHAANRDVPAAALITEVNVSGQVSVGVVFPATQCGFACGQMVALDVYGGIVGREVGGIGENRFPVDAELIMEKEVLPLKCGIEYALTVPAHTH